MGKAFEFADFVREFWVDFIVYDKTPGQRNEVGKWIEGTETPRDSGGIVLPLTNDELKHEANGTYTTKDRKIYTIEPLTKGQRLEYKNQSYTIDQYKDYEAYADVYIYFAKGVGQ
jgi:hypothetical protein